VVARGQHGIREEDGRGKEREVKVDYPSSVRCSGRIRFMNTGEENEQCSLNIELSALRQSEQRHRSGTYTGHPPGCIGTRLPWNQPTAYWGALFEMHIEGWDEDLSLSLSLSRLLSEL